MREPIHEGLTLCLATSRAYMLQMDPPGAKMLSPPANPIISLILARTCGERASGSYFYQVQFPVARCGEKCDTVNFVYRVTNLVGKKNTFDLD